MKNTILKYLVYWYQCRKIVYQVKKKSFTHIDSDKHLENYWIQIEHKRFQLYDNRKIDNLNNISSKEVKDWIKNSTNLIKSRIWDIVNAIFNQ